MTLNGELILENLFDGEISLDNQLDGELYSSLEISTVPAYAGPYQYTPSQSAQTISIANKKATQDITIDPIPSNYGLISWDGSVLTVS